MTTLSLTTITITVVPTETEPVGIRSNSEFEPEPIGPIAEQSDKTDDDFDAPVLYWMELLEDYQEISKVMVLDTTFEYLDGIYRDFLGPRLPFCKVIEDSRDGLPGDEMKLVPLCPNHPSKKFRIIQIWGIDTATKKTTECVAPVEKAAGETVLTRFWNRNRKAGSTRRWLRRRPSPLKASLDLSKLFERYDRILNWIEEHQANCQEWEEWDDRLNTLEDETVMDYCDRVERLTTRQKW